MTPSTQTPDGRPTTFGAWFVTRRSLPSLVALSGILVLAGLLVVTLTNAPVWTMGVMAFGFVAIEYALTPWIIDRLVPAEMIEHDGTKYLTDHILGRIVRRRCRDAGVPLVRLGIVDDGNPNAFTFGHSRRDARVWVTRGLLERLDPDELDAVIAHELGHIRHHDFIVMTIAAGIPMMLWFLARALFDSADDDDEGGEAALLGFALLIGYLISEFILLALSRAREYGADHWACECTGNGDALALALVKIGYGMGQVAADTRRREQRAPSANAPLQSKRERRAERCLESMQIMGIFGPGATNAMETVLGKGIDPRRVAAALRWDVTNPWATVFEKFSTHPLVARRIAALERSRLPGAPRRFGVLMAGAELSLAQRFDIRVRFLGELVIAVVPWVSFSAVLMGIAGHSVFWSGFAIAVAGGLFLAKQRLRYPAGFEAIGEVAELLERLDASPVRGLPVEVHGRVIGRGSPGYVLSSDLVIEDRSGFIALRYRQPVPFGAQLFGLFRAPDYLGRKVVARGWYHRGSQPYIELRDVRTADKRRASRTSMWLAKHVLAGVIVLGGFLTMVSGLAGA